MTTLETLKSNREEIIKSILSVKNNKQFLVDVMTGLSRMVDGGHPEGIDFLLDLAIKNELGKAERFKRISYEMHLENRTRELIYHNCH